MKTGFLIYANLLIIGVFWYGHHLANDNYTRWMCVFMGAFLSCSTLIIYEVDKK